jgi:uncharacterized protein YcfL
MSTTCHPIDVGYQVYRAWLDEQQMDWNRGINMNSPLRLPAEEAAAILGETKARC